MKNRKEGGKEQGRRGGNDAIKIFNYQFKAQFFLKKKKTSFYTPNVYYVTWHQLKANSHSDSTCICQLFYGLNSRINTSFI